LRRGGRARRRRRRQAHEGGDARGPEAEEGLARDRAAAAAKVSAQSAAEVVKKDGSGAAVWIMAACLGGASVIVGVLALVLLPGRYQPLRGLASESSAIGALRTLCSAQALFQSGDMDQNGVLDYATTLQDLARA